MQSFISVGQMYLKEMYMHKSPIFRKAPRKIFLAFFIIYTQPKSTCILKI